MASITNTLISPGINVSEIDLTTVVPTLGTTTGAIAGIFPWGPVGERVLIGSESQLVNTFGQPNSNNAETFFTAANFLAYGNSLYVVRAANTTSGDANAALNAIGNTQAITNASSLVVLNEVDFANKKANNWSFDTNAMFLAKFPGYIGNSLKVAVCDNPSQYSSNVNIQDAASIGNTVTGTISASFVIHFGNYYGTITAISNTANVQASNTWIQTVASEFAVGDIMVTGNSSIGYQYQTIQAIGPYTSNSTASSVQIYFTSPYKNATDYTISNTMNGNTTVCNLQRYWQYQNIINIPPSTSGYVRANGNTVNWASNTANTPVDCMHVVVIDENGEFTGTPGAIVETYTNVSRATDALDSGGQSLYYKTVINNQSNYIWVLNDRPDGTANSANAANIVTSSNVAPINLSFINGQDGAPEGNVSLATIASGYSLYTNPSDVAISLLLQGKPIGGTYTGSSVGAITANNFNLANWLIDNIATTRQDCVVFITPDDAIVAGNKGVESTALVTWRNTLHSSSYAVVDSGYKYQYDRYNDVYRYIPTNGDVAGLCVATDLSNDPWWSPAGFNRGQIKNVVRMRYNPSATDRDYLYSNSINPVVTFNGQGTILFGDKTLTSRPSAFDRINVRRLFITIEQAIKSASDYTLFEFNDAFTRSNFVNLITPYLKDVQARRGITDFYVVCDESNNTPDRIDKNQFWCDIYIKPSRSINFIQLNFVAVATGVQFTEVIGQY
jgi:Phage tail sheath protein subtilisin-like domain/Phage tail sheath C-terminal domain